MRMSNDIYTGSNITRLIIRLRATDNTFVVSLVKPGATSYAVGELMRPDRAELIFDDSRELDTFIEALLQLQKKYRENVGEWRCNNV